MGAGHRPVLPEAYAAARAERDRIVRVYEQYASSDIVRAQWADGPAARHIRDRKWTLLDRLAGGKRAWRSGAWAVDLGAGRRSDLADPGTGSRPGLSRVLALDLLTPCLRALAHQPGVRPVQAHAAFLPLATASVPVVYQSLMLSSVADPGLRRAIYAEIGRVIAPGGLFVSYDTRYPSPLNPDIHRIVLREQRRAFDGWRQEHRTLTVLPPLLRGLAPVSRALCRALEVLPPLRSHRLFVAEKPGAPVARAGASLPAEPPAEVAHRPAQAVVEADAR